MCRRLQETALRRQTSSQIITKMSKNGKGGDRAAFFSQRPVVAHSGFIRNKKSTGKTGAAGYIKTSV